MPDCSICRSLPLAILEALNTEIKAGKLSAQDLGTRFGCLAEDVARHAADCVDRDVPDGYEQLTETLRILRRLIEQFGQDVMDGKQYEFDAEGGVDGRRAVDHYLSVLRETRETVLAMERLRSADATMAELMEQVVNPLSVWTATFFVETCRRLRDDLHDLTNDSTHLQPRIRKITDELAHRLIDRFNKEMLQDMPMKIEQALVKTYAKGRKQKDAKIPQH